MTVWFVGAGPGDPELLTRKAEKLLAVCRICIWAGSLVHPAILDFLPGECIRYDSAEMSLDQIINVIREAHDKNIDVVRLHTGEPSIFGAIGEQMARLDTLGIDYETVPGISSFQAAAAALKTELTMPEVSQTVILTRTGGRTPMPEKESLANITAAGGTVCVFLSVDKTEETAQAFAGALGRDCPA
ncbi:MAG TPA: cobalt-precorrin-4 C(11)-methyltransferase, partial [Spirochaetia bacterium]|nr:cobalt-precorrin-4 C(11)-methyltransferase [Spirochaetia bacterium]